VNCDGGKTCAHKIPVTLRISPMDHVSITSSLHIKLSHEKKKASDWLNDSCAIHSRLRLIQMLWTIHFDTVFVFQLLFHQNSVCCLIHTTSPIHIILLDFITPTAFSEECTPLSSSLCTYSLTSCHSQPPQTQTSSSVPSVHVHPFNVRGPV